jgi:hypothetical protein
MTDKAKKPRSNEVVLAGLTRKRLRDYPIRGIATAGVGARPVEMRQ